MAIAPEPDDRPDDEPDEDRPIEPLPADPRRFKSLPSTSLILDKRAQRELRMERVFQIDNEFNWDLFEVPTVIANGNETYTVDEGQHRVQAVKYRDGLTGQVTYIWCAILSARPIRDQSQLALDILRGRKRHSAYEEWNLCLHAEHEHEQLATLVLRERGLRVGSAASAMTIGSVATVGSIIHGGKFTPEYGAELLARTVELILAAWPSHDPESNISRWDRQILLAVSELVHRNPDLESERFVYALRVRPAPQWLRLGRQDPEEPRHVVIASRIAEVYNKGLRRRRLGW